MNKVWLRLGCAAALALAVAAEPAPAWRVVPAPPAAPAVDVPLPPLAEVTATDRRGQTWQQRGQLSGSVEAARREFAAALGASGWTLDRTVALGQTPARSELMVWSLRTRKILLMVWEMEAGTCGFAWGQER